MLQLSLDFLGKQLERFRPTPAIKPPREDDSHPWHWKHGIAVHLVRQPRAKRYLLRLQPDGTARLVIPRRGSRAEALRFLERSEAWLLKQRAQWKPRQPRPWTEGTHFLFRGDKVILGVEPAAGRVRLSFADQHLSVAHPLPDYSKVVLAHLQRLAEKELVLRTRELARQHDIAIRSITVRAQKTRWGSCSARGTISLNWRLIHAPDSVVDYLIIHELMHRRQMNHSARYWKLVEEAHPDYRAAEQWLRKHRIE